MPGGGGGGVIAFGIDPDIKGLCQTIWEWYILKKLNGVFVSIEWSSFVIKDYIMALKLFPVVCCCGWQKWK